MAEQVGADVASMGSAGAKAMAVVRGDADAYLHSGGQWEWDSAAPVGVARAAGLHASRLDGSPLLYNQAHPYLPDLLMCTPDLAGPLLAALVPYGRRASPGPHSASPGPHWAWPPGRRPLVAFAGLAVAGGGAT